MYHHIADGLTALAKSLKTSRLRRLTPNEIDTIEQGGLKLKATLDALELSRTACDLLQKQVDRMKPHCPDSLHVLEEN